MPQPKPENTFTCRICGHNEFDEVRADDLGSIVIGAPIRVKHCICKGCSAIFGDPELFSGTPFSYAERATEAERGATREFGAFETMRSSYRRRFPGGV